LKPELRFYDEAAQAFRDGDELISFSSGPQYGLCRTGNDCVAPLGCSAKTNTCTACEADTECAQALFEKHICTAAKECLKVECVTDADCTLQICEPTRHACVDCLSNADCSSDFFKVCEQATGDCVACVTDADCTDGFATHCNPSTKFCVPP
jgi:hypothetical protein